MGEWAEINRAIWQSKREMAKSSGCIGALLVPLVWLLGLLKAVNHD